MSKPGRVTTPAPPQRLPALVLTAGRGTRLAPLSYVRAKPAMPVDGEPLICRILRWLAAQGVPLAVLNLHHCPDTITHAVGYGETLGINVRYSWERQLLGSAGGPRHALSLLDTSFFIVNGDTLVDVDLGALARRHTEARAAVTLAVSDHPASGRYGGVVADSQGLVQRFVGAESPSRHFVGVQMAGAEVFRSIEDGIDAATIGGLYDRVIADGNRIATYEIERAHSFYDVGTFSGYLDTALNVAAAAGRHTVPIGTNSRVHPSATVTRTVIWDNVTVDAHCRLTECVVADGVHVPPGTSCKRSAIVLARDAPSHAPGRRLGNILITPVDIPR